MELPVNRFMLALREGRQQIGLWCTLANPYALELVAAPDRHRAFARRGGRHLAQLQVAAATRC